MKMLTVDKYKTYQEGVNKVTVEGLRICRNMKIGQVVRQGDIYIHRVDDNHPHGKKTNNHQLAIGINLGSRHIADESFDVYEGTQLPEYVNSKHFLGQLIKGKKDSSMITHPEHGNICVGKGTFQITHQMDIRTMQRVRD